MVPNNWTFERRVMRKVAVQPSGCWQWIARIDRGGYGQIRVGGVRWIAHRYVYVCLVGEIPAGLTLDHLCRNTACVNPAHLEPVTMAENIRRACWTKCSVGHEFNAANTGRTHYKTGRIARFCRICKNANERRRRARKRAEKLTA